jgi:aerobic-type carbon monoxide dehydrogenase small subunit (CoxS/CutS family)
VGERARELNFVVDGHPVTVPDDGDTLLGVLRDRLGLTGPKDGCSPQGQCGCCTVLVDGQPRVACVTPARRVRDRSITTVDGLDPALRDRWAGALVAHGGSQCGFCTPGIVVRLESLRAGAGEPGLDAGAVRRALSAHLCRCTGWQTVVESALALASPAGEVCRDLDAASRRATLEGGAPQRVGPEVALGRGGFSADTAPEGCLVAVPDATGGWAVGETVAEARRAAGKVQGRRTTRAHRWPLEVPPGDWDATMRTTWVEPAYLEPDASWCEPGGQPSTPLANGGAFGGKADSPLPGVARRLADRYGRPVLALYDREHVTRLGPKRPPVACGARADGTGWLRVVATPGLARAVAAVAPAVRVEEVAVAGPPTSTRLRAAGWAEATVLLAGARGGFDEVVDPATGGRARARVGDGRIEVWVDAGDPLDEVTLRSYCIGAAHMGWSWLTSEAVAVDDGGEVLDLTIRSFGVVRAVDTPTIGVDIAPGDGPPVAVGDAVFVAVAAAGWLAAGRPTDWPIGAKI